LTDDEAFNHFLKVGIEQQRSPNIGHMIPILERLLGDLPADFDDATYKSLNPDVKAEYDFDRGGELHYLTFGRVEHRPYRLEFHRLDFDVFCSGSGAELADRKSKLLSKLDKSCMSGVEFGPWYSPVAAKAEGWRTVVVDYTTGDELRRIARTHEAPAIREALDRIEDVDVVMSGGNIAERCLALQPEGFDYVIASHVIEHVPDIVEWFRQLSRMLKPDCRISLAIPDLRYCFDFFKSPSSTADALLAHREKRIIHSPETMFMAHGYVGFVNGVGCWVANNKTQPKQIANFEHAKTQYLKYLEGYENGVQDYHDAHCWFFTPSSFKLMVFELAALRLIDFTVDSIQIEAGSEFICQLVRLTDSSERRISDEQRNALMQGVIQEISERSTRFENRE
jgi:SAM-dependent methyltransferase